MADSLNVSGSVNMPFNLEAEQSVLGSILIKPECIEEVIEHVNAESFYLPQHNAIFSSMMVMYSNSKAIDPVILPTHLLKTESMMKQAEEIIFCNLHNLFRQPQMLYIMLKS
jgi:replicative DNA helicase